jgi:hypothetical protein
LPRIGQHASGHRHSGELNLFGFGRFGGAQLSTIAKRKPNNRREKTVNFRRRLMIHSQLPQAARRASEIARAAPVA